MIYDIDAVRFIFEHYVTFSHGDWPDPIKTEGRRPGVSYHAPFEDPCIIAAEISKRVKCCGFDGILVEYIYGMMTGQALGVERIAKVYHLDKVEVYRRINKVAFYCTDGEFFKNLTYRMWGHKEQTSRHYQGKIRSKV